VSSATTGSHSKSRAEHRERQLNRRSDKDILDWIFKSLISVYRTIRSITAFYRIAPIVPEDGTVISA